MVKKKMTPTIEELNVNSGEPNKDVGRYPDFKGEGVAVWVNQDKNGKKYLNINILNGSIKVNAFKYEPKEKTDV